MKNFFIMTRGRTGSTAVIDELGKIDAICAVQELFLKYTFKEKKDYEYIFNIIPPFDAWKMDKFRKFLPALLYPDSARAHDYLKEAEAMCQRRGEKIFGFKLLSHQLDERPYLGGLLKNRGYQAVYLTRNLARQVLSGMVAAQRGYYNIQQDIDDSRRYEIELDKFQQLLIGEIEAVERDYARLKEKDFSFVAVTYEEFISNRRSFYEKIFECLGLPIELPPHSNWKVLIKDVKYTVSNYDAVVERTTALGVPLDS